MRILHVTIGDPYVKVGGLNKYCMDLANCQRLDGHTVYILYPGSFLNSKNPIIKDRNGGLFEIWDALPVAITYGIGNPKLYMTSIRNNPYQSFLSKLQPDIIHVHSIQGIHLEFFETTQKLGIPLLFTTHDYYPICPRCVLLDAEGKVCDAPSAQRCSYCNFQKVLSINKQRIIQSKMYQRIKNSLVIKKMKALSNEGNNLELNRAKNEQRIDDIRMLDKQVEYGQLLDYYKNIMSKMSLIHCNSSITEKQYKRFFPDIPCKVIPITHAGLLRSKHKRKDVGVLNISYMGGMSTHKGYYVVMDAAKKLDQRVPVGWKLWFYGGEFASKYKNEKFQYCGFFTSDKEEEVWDNTDLLIVASQWVETFGFVVLESLCRGIPVLCSDLVGSKDLVANVWENLIFKHDCAEELEEKIEKFMDVEYYNEIQRKVERTDLVVEMEFHSRHMLNLYRGLI